MSTSRTFIRQKCLGPLLSGALILAASAAHAQVLLHRNNSATITPINAGTLIVINGVNTFDVNIPGAAFVPVMIVFDAECGVGGATTNRLDIDILLDAAGGAVSFNPIGPGG